VFRSVPLRIALTLALSWFVWVILAMWTTDAPSARTVEAILASLCVFLIIGLAVPSRAFWALRIAAGIIGAGFVAYFVAGTDEGRSAGAPNWSAIDNHGGLKSRGLCGALPRLRGDGFRWAKVAKRRRVLARRLGAGRSRSCCLISVRWPRRSSLTTRPCST
jgi:hypothetical protein